MPRQLVPLVGQSVHFVGGFLHIVLAEVTLAISCKFSDGTGRLLFGDGNQAGNGAALSLRFGLNLALDRLPSQ